MFTRGYHHFGSTPRARDKAPAHPCPCREFPPAWTRKKCSHEPPAVQKLALNQCLSRSFTIMISCIVYVLYHHLQGFIHHVLSMEWVNHGDMWWDIQPLWGMPGIGNEKQFFLPWDLKIIICPWGIMIMRTLIIYNMNLQQGYCGDLSLDIFIYMSNHVYTYNQTYAVDGRFSQ